ncbi:hypothetical protein ACWC2K_07165 [Streptomyces chattanoogensis]
MADDAATVGPLGRGRPPRSHLGDFGRRRDEQASDPKGADLAFADSRGVSAAAAVGRSGVAASALTSIAIGIRGTVMIT